MQVNPEMVTRLENAGLNFTGKDDTGRRMEVGILTHGTNDSPLFLILFSNNCCFCCIMVIFELISSL